jgi:hypothetical protein
MSSDSKGKPSPTWCGECGNCGHLIEREIYGVFRPMQKEVWISCAKCGKANPIRDTEVDDGSRRVY